MQFEPDAYSGEINISGKKKSRKQLITNSLVNLGIYLIFIYFLYSNNFLKKYVLQPSIILFVVSALYMYGKYIYEIVLKNEAPIITETFKNRRYLLQFKVYFIFIYALIYSYGKLLIFDSFIKKIMLAETIYVFLDLAYRSSIVILSLDSISWILKDILILFNLQKIKNIDTKKFVYNKLYQIESDNDGRWQKLQNEKKSMIIMRISFYIIYRLIAVMYFWLYYISLMFDKVINICINFINRFINKKLYTFSRSIFIGVLVYYYVFLNYNNDISEGVVNIYEYISTIFIIPLVLDELSASKKIK